MSQNHREPEVPEAEVPAVECLDGLARITSEELATTHSVKMASSRMLILQVREWLSVWEKCSYAHRQVDEQPTKRSEKNDDKSAVATENTTIGLRIHRFCGRAQTYENQSDVFSSLELSYVMKTFETKLHRLE